MIYTTPIKALSNQKFRDLREQYGDAVGLLTGDSREPRAPIMVMTTEVAAEHASADAVGAGPVDAIIFDEIHYLADPERGTTWEESIILCPDHIQLVCLSATVTNAGEIAAWIGRTHRPIHLITHFERAVPLALYYFLDGELHLSSTGQAAGGRLPHVGGEMRRHLSRPVVEEDGSTCRGEGRAARRREIVDALQRQEHAAGHLLPVQPARLRGGAELCAAMRADFATERRQRARDRAID